MRHVTISYLILAVVVAVAVGSIRHYDLQVIRRHARDDCRRSNVVAANQTLVLRTLLYIHGPVSRTQIAQALKQVPRFEC